MWWAERFIPNFSILCRSNPCDYWSRVALTEFSEIFLKSLKTFDRAILTMALMV